MKPPSSHEVPATEAVAPPLQLLLPRALRVRSTLRVPILLVLGLAGAVALGLLGVLALGSSAQEIPTAGTGWPMTRSFRVQLVPTLWLLGAAALLPILATGVGTWFLWQRPLVKLRPFAHQFLTGDWAVPVAPPKLALPEVRAVQLSYESLRQVLLHRLRSSTELSLQLASEVSRQTALLAQHTQDLERALVRLRSARQALLRGERLATLGRLSEAVVRTVREPIDEMAQLVCSQAPLTLPPVSRSDAEQRAALRAFAHKLTSVLQNALRVSEVIGSLRGVGRMPPSHVPPPSDDRSPLAQALALLADPPSAAQAGEQSHRPEDLA